MKVNLQKSVFSIFTRARTILSQPPNIHLNGSPLSYHRHVRYLGLWFSPDLSWGYHGKQILAKAKASANLIVRKARDAPSLLVVRSLVLAITRAQISYGFPIWEPSPSLLSSLQAQLLRPLRASLGLPQSARSDSVLAEFGVCSLKRYWEQQALAWAARMIRFQFPVPSNLDDFPAVSLFLARQRECYLPHLRKLPHSHVHGQCSLPFRATTLIKEDWEKGQDKIRRLKALPLLNSSILKRYAVSLSYRDWLEHKETPLRQYRADDVTEMALYLKADARPVACLRARLRFGRSSLLAHQLRMKLVDSATCKQCNSGADESVDHALLSCTKYAAERETLRQELRQLGVPNLETSLILGRIIINADSGLPIRSDVLRVTGVYLSSLSASRSDPI